MNYGKKHDLPFGIMDVAGLLRLNIRRRAPGQVYVDCPICGDRRGKMNLNTEKDLWRCNYCGEGGGMLSLYAKVYGVSNSDAYREICDALAVNGFSPDYTVSEKTTPAEAEQSDAASVQEVHQTLSMLLSMLTLIPAHHTHLQSVRGLSDDEITRFGFKSTPPPFLCRSLTNRLVKAGCRVQGVPGFYVDDNGCWTVKFHQRTSGIIIPIFGVDGLIRGAQIRLDHPLKDKDDPPEKTGVKYLTLSSTGKRMGTTSGSPIHFVGDPCSRVVYVTEGCLKADVAHALMHRTFVATLGANNTAKLDGLFAFLHRNGTEEIIEAEDMDKYITLRVRGGSNRYSMVVPDSCEALISKHTVPGETPEKIIVDLQSAVQREKLHASFEFAVEKPFYPSFLLNDNLEEICRLRHIFEEVTGEELKLVCSDGVSDNNHWSTIGGIPSVCFGPGGKGLHQSDEWVSTEQMENVLEVYLRFFLEDEE